MGANSFSVVALLKADDRNFNNTFGRARGTLTGFNKAAKGVSSQWSANFATMSSSASGFASGIGSMSATAVRALGPVGIGIGTVGAAMVKLGTDSFEFARQFESSMTMAATLSEEVFSRYDYYKEKIVGLAVVAGKSGVEMADAYYQVVSAGYDGEKGLQLLAEASKGARAGNVDMTTSIDGLTTVMNAWGYSMDESSYIMDTFFKGIEEGKTTFQEMSDGINIVASTASNAGVPFTDISEALADLTSKGIPTNKAFTAIRNAIMGTTKTFGDAYFKTHTLREGMIEMTEAAGNSANKLKKLMGNEEGVTAALTLGSGDKNKILASYDSFFDGLQDATQRNFIKMNNTTNAQWEIFQANMKKALMPVGDTLNDWAKNALKSINKAFETFDENEKKVRDTTQRVNELALAYFDAQDDEREQIRIVEKLNEIAPDLVKNLENEENAITVLRDRLKEYNAEQINRLVIAKKQDQIDEQMAKKNELLVKKKEQEVAMHQRLAQIKSNVAENKYLNGHKRSWVNDFNDIYYSKTKSTYEKLEAIRKHWNDGFGRNTNGDMFKANIGAFKGSEIFGDFQDTNAQLAEVQTKIDDLTTDRKEIEIAIYGHVVEPEVSTLNPDGGGGNDGNKGGEVDITTYKAALEAKKKLYEQYELLKKTKTKEYADEFLTEQIKQSKEYQTILKSGGQGAADAYLDEFMKRNATFRDYVYNLSKDAKSFQENLVLSTEAKNLNISLEPIDLDVDFTEAETAIDNWMLDMSGYKIEIPATIENDSIIKTYEDEADFIAKSSLGKKTKKETMKASEAYSMLAENAGRSFDILSKGSDSAVGAWLGYVGGILSSVPQVIASITAFTTTKLAADTASVAGDMAKGSAGALSSTSSYPFPLNIALGAGALAAFLGLFASIAKVPKFADGGIAFGPTLGLMGEYAGAANNPEVIAPLNKLKQLIQPEGGGFGGRVVFEIKGDRLQGVLNNHNVKNRRMR